MISDAEKTLMALQGIRIEIHGPVSQFHATWWAVFQDNDVVNSGVTKLEEVALEYAEEVALRLAGAR